MSWIQNQEVWLPVEMMIIKENSICQMLTFEGLGVCIRQKIICLCVFSGSHYMLFQEVASYPKEWWRRSQGKVQEFLRTQRPRRKAGRSTAPSWRWSSLRRPTERKQKSLTWESLVPLLQQIGISCTDKVSYSPLILWCPPYLTFLFCHTSLGVPWKLVQPLCES